MSEKSLLSLREIAEVIGLNYRTVIDYKNTFQKFIKFENDGHGIKYSEKYVDFFRMIVAMKEEGYSISITKMILSGEIGLPAQEHLREWLLEWSKNRPCGMDGGIQPQADGCINPNPDGGIHSQADGVISPNMEGHIHPQEDGCINPHLDGSVHPPADEQINPNLKKKINEIIAKTLQEHDAEQKEALDKLRLTMEDKLETTSTQATAQTNYALTQIYQVITKLQEVTTGLNQRLNHLEKELGAEPGGGLELTELDLEGIQLGGGSAEDQVLTKYEHATLDFVKASVSEGKPDREAVVQWLLREKGDSPGISYSELAGKLNEAGVPTLSGREEWNRSVLRNLAVRG